jgi:hypothetical protein
MPSSGAQKVHSIGCSAMHEALLSSQWIWPQPLLTDQLTELASFTGSEAISKLQVDVLEAPARARLCLDSLRIRDVQ